jgi:hypothetical protein
VEALIVVETLLLVLLAMLVAGLLRSHAEILRRLDAVQPTKTGSRAGDAGAPAVPAPAPGRDADELALDLVGTTLRGESVKVAVSNPSVNTLLAFLSTGCTTCQTFWEGLRPNVRPAMPSGTRLVVVTKDTAYESPSRLREIAPADVPLVMSSQAWDGYEVPGSPYFVYVDGASGRIRGEGLAQSWEQVLSLLRDALADADVAAEALSTPPSAASSITGLIAVTGRRGADRSPRVDAELRTAGIGGGHPSLYVAGDPTRNGGGVAGREGRPQRRAGRP